MDSSRNLYGTTSNGGAYGFGTVFELIASAGSYTEKVPHSFAGTPTDEVAPAASLLMEPSSNLSFPPGAIQRSCCTVSAASATEKRLLRLRLWTVRGSGASGPEFPVGTADQVVPTKASVPSRPELRQTTTFERQRVAARGRSMHIRPRCSSRSGCISISISRYRCRFPASRQHAS